MRRAFLGAVVLHGGVIAALGLLHPPASTLPPPADANVMVVEVTLAAPATVRYPSEEQQETQDSVPSSDTQGSGQQLSKRETNNEKQQSVKSPFQHRVSSPSLHAVPRPSAIVEAKPARSVQEMSTLTSTSVGVKSTAPPPPSPRKSSGLTRPAQYQLGAPHTPRPLYPWSARRRGKQGRVVIDLLVSPTGHPQSLTLIESSGDSSLDQAALDTLKTWRLSPALSNNIPISSRITVPIRFELHDD